MNNNSNPQYIIDPLFDFQSICDTDFGLYRLIKKEYYDKSIFRKEIFESKDEKFVKTMLLAREKLNPLFIFCKKNVLSDDEIDDLYKQFLDEEYEKILSLSTPTAITKIAAVANSVKKMINVTILCNNEKEKEWIFKYTNKFKCIISDYKDFDISNYDTIYIKDIHSLLLFKQESIDTKNIVFSKFVFNMENTKVDLPIIEIAEKYYKNNKFITAEPYKNITIPMNEMVKK